MEQKKLLTEKNLFVDADDQVTNLIATTRIARD
jgi:hypothetical protein